MSLLTLRWQIGQESVALADVVLNQGLDGLASNYELSFLNNGSESTFMLVSNLVTLDEVRC